MTVVGKHTGIRGNVVAVRKGGDFDCTQAEKEYGPYVSAITPGTSAKLTLVLNVLSNRYGRYVCPSCGNIDNAQTEMSAMNLFGFAAPHVKSCPGCQLREVLDFDMPEQVTNPSFTWKSSSYGYTRSAKELAVNRLAELKGFSSPLREAGDQFGNDPEYLECHQATHAHLWVNPNSHTTCGIGIVVAAVDTGDQQAHYEANANRGQNTAEEFRKKEHLAAIRALGYQPKDHEFAGGNPHRPGQFGTLPDSSYRAFADRPDDPAVKVKDSFRVHGLYVIAQDMKDHGLDLPGHPQGVGQALKDANAHFLKRSSKQHQFRLDMIPGTDEPDVSFLRLALTEKQIFTGSNSPYSGKWTDRPVWYQTIERAVNAAGFNHPRKVYVIFYDGKLDVGGVGGFHNVTINNAHKAAKLTKWHYKVHLHEIFHTLGFTKKCMPQVDKSGWHSTIQGDVLQSLGDDIDKGRVSYYDHKMKNRPGNCVLDLAKSIFLTPSTQPVAQLPPGWKLNEHCITGPKNGKVCSAMTASDYNTSGSGGRAGGASTGGGRRQVGQVNAAKAGIAEVEGSRSVTHGDPVPPP